MGETVKILVHLQSNAQPPWPIVLYSALNEDEELVDLVKGFRAIAKGYTLIEGRDAVLYIRSDQIVYILVEKAKEGEEDEEAAE